MSTLQVLVLYDWRRKLFYSLAFCHFSPLTTNTNTLKILCNVVVQVSAQIYEQHSKAICLKLFPSNTLVEV